MKLLIHLRNVHSKVYLQTSANLYDKAEIKCMLYNCKNKELNYFGVVNVDNVELVDKNG